MIRCQICKKLFRQLPMHLICRHGITVEEYKKKYGVKHVVCKSLRKATSERVKGNDYTVGCGESLLGNTNGVGNKSRTGQKQSEEEKENRRKYWTDERKKEMSKELEGNTNAKGHTYKMSEKNKEKARVRMIQQHKDGKIVGGGYAEWYPVKNHIGNIVMVQGSYEKRVGEALTKLGIRWKKYTEKGEKKEGFPYKLYKKEKRYFPDFYLRDNRYYLEMKGYIGKDNFEEITAKQMMMDRRGKRKGFICEMMFDIDIRKLEREVRKNEELVTS